MRLIIEPIPAFDDNYIWLLRRPDQDHCAVVDPGDAEPVLERLRRDRLRLDSVLITHHHGDHIGGLQALGRAWPDAEVFGPADRRISGLTRVVGDGDHLRLRGLGLELEVLAVPGHTSTHIAYLGGGDLFCGDTLFAAGCGRVFDGTFVDLAASLRRLAALAPETRCYCAHEYTLANLGFARWVEPESALVAAAIEAAERRRSAGQPTVPTSLAEEFKVNPFLRTAEPSVIEAAERFSGARLSGPTEVFTALRRWKDERYD